MASSKFSAFILVISLLLSSTFSNACGTCGKLPPAGETCPLDALKLGVCADLLGLVNGVVGSPPSGTECCALLEGLADLEVALCLCTAIKANVLGLNLNIPVTLGLLVSACEKSLPPGFTCP